MLFFSISFLSFLLLLLSKPLPTWVNELRIVLFLIGQEFFYSLIHWLRSCKLKSFSMAARKEVVARDENVEEMEEMGLLDLPELTLECILGKLSPAGLFNMAGVCGSLRDRCRSDHLWERHMREKWSRVLGQTAHRDWQMYTASRRVAVSIAAGNGKLNGWFESLFCAWPFSWLKKSKVEEDGKERVPCTPLPGASDASIMSWYLALESGKFWFRAQVYNRENGHVGFMLSCYDAELSYDRRTDTFHARYPPHGRRIMNIEEGVCWERLRARPVDTPAVQLHASDCMNELQPGDHIEIQWRRNKEFPYGWWYGVVGHQESCDRNEQHCRCLDSDTVILEFNQYTPGSRWRQTVINRKAHTEEGNETDGFYGGIRKLHCKDEISTWRRLWPTEFLD